MNPLKRVSSEAWAVVVIIVMLIALIGHLMVALQTSRNNERELSRRLYQSVRNERQHL